MLPVQDIDFYAATIRECIELTKNSLCILIDSIDEAQNLQNLSWMPIKLRENVKIILTCTSSYATDVSQSPENIVLSYLRTKLSADSIIHLDQFSVEQWKDVLSLGGGDFYAANGALHLPEAWQECNDKIPIQAKVI